MERSRCGSTGKARTIHVLAGADGITNQRAGRRRCLPQSASRTIRHDSWCHTGEAIRDVRPHSENTHLRAGCAYTSILVVGENLRGHRRGVRTVKATTERKLKSANDLQFRPERRKGLTCKQRNSSNKEMNLHLFRQPYRSRTGSLQPEAMN